MSGEGKILILGLGPGPAAWQSPEVSMALQQVDDLIGYGPYLDRCPERPGQGRHKSDNRDELFRARLALSLAGRGRRVGIVSGGDPGIFGMAAAVMEALEEDEPARMIDLEIMPGISAMQAAAARLGAPLGHDFCVLSLSDRLKPWETIERRLQAAALGDFVIVLYNPASKARPRQIFTAFALLREVKSRETPVAFARAVGRADEAVHLTTLGDADPGLADMATLIIIGSSSTRLVPRHDKPPLLYTPRSMSSIKGV